MPRDSQIPLFLWIATAILVHLMWGGGAEHASDQIEETLDIGRFARSVRQHVRLTTQTLEIAMVQEEPKDADADEPASKELPKAPEPEEPPLEDSLPKKPTPQTEQSVPKPTVAEPEKKEPEPEPEKEEKKKEEDKPEKKQQQQDVKPVELPEQQQRVAVRQHVEDKDQQDNPDAQFLGEHANRVKEQTQARITSTEQNAPKPTPGGPHSGPDQQPGNSSETKVAQMDDRDGDPDRPPSQAADSSKPPPVAQAVPKAGAPQQAPEQPRVPPQAGQQAQAAVQAQEQAPTILSVPGGIYSVPRQRQALREQRARQARQRITGQQRKQDPTALLGLGAGGLTENGVNLNLTPSTAVAVIGQEQLKQERTRDGERRRSEHRGSWNQTSFEKYKSAIENYVAGVKPGNQTALNTAHSPFANYLNSIHQRLHPMFAGRFLSSLDRMGREHPLNDMEMIAKLEIVLHPDDGRIVRMGVTKASGVTAFDIGALDSVRKASPFGTAPKSIVSPDGNVYLHWGFHRNPNYACSTFNARPYKIKAHPKSVPPKVAPPPAKPEEGQEPPPGRQGQREPKIDRDKPSKVRTARR